MAYARLAICSCIDIWDTRNLEPTVRAVERLGSERRLVGPSIGVICFVFINVFSFEEFKFVADGGRNTTCSGSAVKQQV